MPKLLPFPLSTPRRPVLQSHEFFFSSLLCLCCFEGGSDHCQNPTLKSSAQELRHFQSIDHRLLADNTAPEVHIMVECSYRVGTSALSSLHTAIISH